MSVLTEIELKKIINWLPYRSNWPIDRNKVNDAIDTHYGNLKYSFSNSKAFNCYLTEDGGTANHIEYICYPAENNSYSGSGILVMISLCGPVAAYGQTSVSIATQVIWGHCDIETNRINTITLQNLKVIETEILNILTINHISILRKDFLSSMVSKNFLENIDSLYGNRYIDVILQGII